MKNSSLAISIARAANGIENTPDEGRIAATSRIDGNYFVVKFSDNGVGITAENQKLIFTGFFHTQDTDLYGSRNVYDFGAGGKGLDLLQMKAYARRFGFDISMTSSRCIHIPTDSDICPGKTSLCPHISRPEDCARTGTTTFCLTFPVPREYLKIETRPGAGA